MNAETDEKHTTSYAVSYDRAYVSCRETSFFAILFTTKIADRALPAETRVRCVPSPRAKAAISGTKEKMEGQTCPPRVEAAVEVAVRCPAKTRPTRFSRAIVALDGPAANMVALNRFRRAFAYRPNDLTAPKMRRVLSTTVIIRAGPVGPALMAA